MPSELRNPSKATLGRQENEGNIKQKKNVYQKDMAFKVLKKCRRGHNVPKKKKMDERSKNTGNSAKQKDS